MSASKLVRLGELFAPRLGMIDPSKHPDEMFALYSVPAFENGTPDRVLGGDIGSAKQIVQAGDVLLSRIVPHIRRAWVVEPDVQSRTIASNEWLVFRSERIDPRYLRHLLVEDKFHSAFMKTVSGVGGSLLRAKASYVSEINIPLPPLAEQRRIAGVLDRVEGVRGKRREAARQLERLALSVFERIVGDPIRNPHGWPVKTGEELFASLDYGTSAKCYTERAPGALPVIRIPNVTAEGQIDWTGLKYAVLEPREREKLRLRDGDILFVRTNGNPDYIGRCAVISDGRDSLFASYLIRGRVSEASGYHPDFLQAVASHPSFRSLLMAESKTTAGNYNISAAGLRRLRFVAPPPELQMEFLGTIAAIAKVRGGMAKSQMDALALATSISGAAFGAG